MLKLDAFSKEENGKFSFKRNKVESFDLQNGSAYLLHILSISLLEIYKIEVGLKFIRLRLAWNL